MKRLIYELKGTPMEVSPGDIVDRYIKGLKPAARKYVQTNAPGNWWTDPDQLFSKALHYEINISAATTSDAPAQLNSQLPQPPHGAPSTAGRGFGGGRGRAVASLAVATGHPAAVAASRAGALGGTLPILALLPVQLSTAPATRTSQFLSRPGNTASKLGNVATAREPTTTPGNASTLLATIRALRMH
jgi:hypothetical protein